MLFLRKYSSLVALPMAALMMVLSVPLGAAQAALVTTDQVVERTAIDADRARVAAFLSRAEIRGKMQAMGVNPDEAANRVALMTDDEVQQVAARIDTLPAGQSLAVDLLGVAIVIALIILVTDLIGVTDVYPFIKGGKIKS